MKSGRQHEETPTLGIHLALLGGLFVLAGLAVVACTRPLPKELPGPSGGDATVNNTGANAFAQPVDGLSQDELQGFVVGNSFFNDNWVAAPASTTGRDGLGPVFNAQSCSSCHFKDGRGQPRSAKAPKSNGLLIRLSVVGEDPHGGPLGDPTYGTQFQDRGISGVPAEGAVIIDNSEIRGRFDDGTPYTLLKPNYTLTELAYGPLDTKVMTSPRVAPGVFGSGLLEAIPEKLILNNADPKDANGDGISGRANRVWSTEHQKTVLGRFGWKANVASVKEQVSAAFRGDIGLTTSLDPDQDCTAAEKACMKAPNGGEPELDDHKLDRVTLYTRTLAVPERRDKDSVVNQHGSEIFDELNCSACHKAEMSTGVTSPKMLSEQVIHPYTDLLLHDMGEGLADGRPDYLATGSEWRTPPLWGIGLTETVNRHTRFLHDGRARNLTEAILWHGGEAAASQRGFLALGSSDRDALISFLNSL